MRMFFAALALLLFGMSSAQAWDFLKPYAQVGPWEILGTDDLENSCVADMDNGQVALRIAYNSKFKAWYVGVPYYDGGSPMASFGMGGKGYINDGVQMNTNVLDGWALYNFSDNPTMISQQPDGVYLTFQLDRGEQSWQLNNKSQMFAKLIECANNSGNKPAAPAQPAKISFLDENGCPKPGGLFRSPASNQAISVTFRDQKPATLFRKKLYWIDLNGNLVETAEFSPEGLANVNTYQGHLFVAKDWMGKCIGGVLKAEAGKPVVSFN